MNQELETTKDDKKVVDVGVTDAALTALKAKYAEADSSTPALYLEGVKELRTLRGSVEKHRKSLKADSLAWGRLVDSEAKRITASLVAMETPLKKLKQADDDLKAEKAAEVARIAQERLDRLQAMVTASFGMARLDGLEDLDSGGIHLRIQEVEKVEIDDSFEDFQGDAYVAREALLRELRLGMFRRAKQEQEDKARAEAEAALAAEREALEKEKLALAAEAQRVFDEGVKNKRLLDEQAAALAAEKAAAEKAAQAERDRVARVEKEEKEARELDERTERLRLADIENQKAEARRVEEEEAARLKKEEADRVAAEAEEVARLARLKKEEADRTKRDAKEKRERLARLKKEKDAKAKSDLDQLLALMGAAIGAEKAFAETHLATLVVLGKGMFLTEDLDMEIVRLAVKVEDAMEVAP